MHVIKKLAIAAALLAAPQMASAAVIINAVEDTGAGTVVFTTSGSLNLSSAVFGGTAAGGFGGINPSTGYLRTRGFVNLTLYDLTASDGAFGAGGSQSAGLDSGAGIWIDSANGRFGVDTGYVSGAAMTGMTLFYGNFAFLGLTKGSYDYAFEGDTITVNIGSVDVPLPAAAPLLLGALGLIGVAARRKG